MVVVSGWWNGAGGDGGWGWDAADVACASYAGVGVGRLGGGLGRVNEVEHGARHLCFLVMEGSGFAWWRWYVCEERKDVRVSRCESRPENIYYAFKGLDMREERSESLRVGRRNGEHESSSLYNIISPLIMGPRPK